MTCSTSGPPKAKTPTPRIAALASLDSCRAEDSAKVVSFPVPMMKDQGAGPEEARAMGRKELRIVFKNFRYAGLVLAAALYALPAAAETPAANQTKVTIGTAGGGTATAALYAAKEEGYFGK